MTPLPPPFPGPARGEAAQPRRGVPPPFGPSGAALQPSPALRVAPPFAPGQPAPLQPATRAPPPFLSSRAAQAAAAMAVDPPPDTKTAAAAAPAVAAAAAAPALTHLRVGYWNCYRLTGADEKAASAAAATKAAKRGLALATIDAWLTGANAPHVLILSEVTKSGLLNGVDEFLSDPATAAAWKATPIGVAGKKNKDKVSPCSFLVLDRVGATVDCCGMQPNSKRPIVYVEADGWLVYGVHCTANSKGTAEKDPPAWVDAMDAVTNITAHAEDRPCMVLGDMNIDIGALAALDGMPDWATAVDAGVGPTHRERRTLDYAWGQAGAGVGRVTASGGAPAWNDFPEGDHKPIEFLLRLR